MKKQVISDYFREIEDALKQNDFRDEAMFDPSDVRKAYDQLKQKKSLENMDTMFGRVFYFEEEEKPIQIKPGLTTAGLLLASGMFDGYESLASKIFSSIPAEEMGIPAIDDRRFRRDRYDALILSDWGNAIDARLDYLEAVKKIVFQSLLQYSESLNLSDAQLHVFQALAEIELKVLAEERSRILQKASEIWKLIKKNTGDRNLLRLVSEDLLEKAGKREEELFINDGEIRFHVPVKDAERYQNLFRL